MGNLQRRWKRIPTPIRQSLVLVVGACVVVGGLILVPLPGPGWAIVFLGFAILATEFAFAVRIRDKLTNALRAVAALGKRLIGR